MAEQSEQFIKECAMMSGVAYRRKGVKSLLGSWRKLKVVTC
jgi:hypothetical protein